MSGFSEITEDGFKVKSFQEIREELREDWRTTFGGDIDLSETSPDGHHVDLEAATVASVAALLQGVQSNFDRRVAVGVWLDRLAAFLGLQRAEGETDASLRLRMDAATVAGFATYDGMLTWLQERIDANVTLHLNDEPTADSEGVPGHSFRVSVPEGYVHKDSAGVDDTASWIATQIWHCKPAGITPVGDKSGVCTDAAGGAHTMFWISPTAFPFDLNVQISKYGEEALPTDYETQIDSAVREWAVSQYTPGKDVIAQRLTVPVYSVSGIENVSVSVAESGSGLFRDRLDVGAGYYASVGTISVSIVEV